VDRHAVKQHAVEQHAVERHAVERHVVNSTPCQKSMLSNDTLSKTNLPTVLQNFDSIVGLVQTQASYLQ
jgi:hypothetical protein